MRIFFSFTLFTPLFCFSFRSTIKFSGEERSKQMRYLINNFCKARRHNKKFHVLTRQHAMQVTIMRILQLHHQSSYYAKSVMKKFLLPKFSHSPNLSMPFVLLWLHNQFISLYNQAVRAISVNQTLVER